MVKSKLNPGNYKGTYKVVGGELCFDFTNTVSYRNREVSHEWLDTFENVATWSNVTGVFSKKESIELLNDLVSDNQRAFKWLEHLKMFREIVFELFKEVAERKDPSTSHIEFLNDKKKELFFEALLDYRDSEFMIKVPNGYSLQQKMEYHILKSVFQVLLFSDLSRVKICTACHWLFYDKSRNKSRQWCVMADCGNRNKVNNYLKRQKEK